MDRAENIRKLKAEALLPREKKIYRLKSVSDKKRERDSGAKEESMWPWFLERRPEMTGKCMNCGDKTEKRNEQYFHFCICHILPKKLFPSVAQHPLNWIELCHFGRSCHTNMDNYFIDITEMNCWDTIVERFIKLYPFIAKEERKNIPEALLQYVKNEIDL